VKSRVARSGRRLRPSAYPGSKTAALNPDRRWTHASITAAWSAACTQVGVVGVSVYPGTKHSTATELFRRGIPRETIQKALGHADPRSTDHYVVLADEDTLDVFRRRP
jgi:integrase